MSGRTGMLEREAQGGKARKGRENPNSLIEVVCDELESDE
jgi:hypothetical protein